MVHADTVREVMGKLKDAFIEVAKEDDSAPVMENTQQLYAGLTYGKGALNEVLLSDDIAFSHSLDSVPEDYEKIILTRSREEALNNVRLIPYYRFIFDRSDNRKKV